MVDGQIHNVMYVAELINEIKQELEEKHGPLSKVSVAAAGRSLKTEQASVTINIRNRPIFTEEDISRLELQVPFNKPSNSSYNIKRIRKRVTIIALVIQSFIIV